MKLVIINNGTHRLPELTQAFSGHHVEVVHYGGHLDWDYLNSFDAIVLSGSSQNQAYSDFYQAELDYVCQTDKPVLAICLGFELLCLLYDLPIYELPKRVEGSWPISVQEDFAELFGHSHVVHEKHKWVTHIVSDEFSVMFISNSGIEGLVHKTRPLLGVQFHPEVVQSEDPNPITAQQLLDYLMNRHDQLPVPADATQKAEHLR